VSAPELLLDGIDPLRMQEASPPPVNAGYRQTLSPFTSGSQREEHHAAPHEGCADGEKLEGEVRESNGVRRLVRV
jgi:hypothetical protein